MIAEDKQKLRVKIWGSLENYNLIRTQKSCFGRIPDFKGAEIAASKLRSTQEWQDSKVVFTSPDSALVDVREYALLDQKTLIMATPKIKEGYLLINPQMVKNKEKIAATIEGAFQFGEKIDTFPDIDLVVEGSLAVDLEGNRLGKGGGYADREISHLFGEEVITRKTPISSIVHPLQIAGKIPTEAHDQKIQLLVTPEMVLRIDSLTSEGFL